VLIGNPLEDRQSGRGAVLLQFRREAGFRCLPPSMLAAAGPSALPHSAAPRPCHRRSDNAAIPVAPTADLPAIGVEIDPVGVVSRPPSVDGLASGARRGK
jgi:hypothetical protein